MDGDIGTISNTSNLGKIHKGNHFEYFLPMIMSMLIYSVFIYLFIDSGILYINHLLPSMIDEHLAHCNTPPPPTIHLEYIDIYFRFSIC